MSDHDQALVRDLLRWLRFDAANTVLINTSTGYSVDLEDIEALAAQYIERTREVSP